MSALSRILQALDEAPSTADELALVAGVPEKSIRSHLSELRRMGLVQRDGKVTKEITFQRRVVLWKRSAA